MTRFVWIFLALLVSLPLMAEEPGRPASPSDLNDPLLRALQELQREVDELRGEIGAKAPGKKPRVRQPRATPGPTKPAVASPVKPQSATSENATARTIPAAPRLPAVNITAAKSDHWSFQPMADPALPNVKDQSWCRDDLDRFILAKLDHVKLHPNVDADRYHLLRRVSYDLTGLPPSAEEIEGFVNDPASLDDALARVVDRYLQSPRFGERWGRHWLDVVRYADSVGRNWNAPFNYAWRYRDYVIDSFNNDKPYDQFLTEQLAGDLLSATDVESRRELLTATAFLALGPMDIIEPEGESMMMDRIDEQIDVTTRAFLGLTVACARCHDHKYEPISSRDYYALAGVFYSTNTKSGQRRGNYVADDDMILLPATDGRTTPIPGVHSMADMTREHREGGYREVHWTTDPNLAMAAIEGDARDCPIRIDGEAYKRGPTPPRGDFHFAGLSGLGTIPPDSSGRLQLASWVVSPDNPLTARVMVNRVWQHLFGRGLVESVDNFGVSGESPTHPELLDHLATRFRTGDSNTSAWSVKPLVRAIVLSRTYRLSSAGNPVNQQRDAANVNYWRMNTRRLEVEAVRDSMLFAAEQLTFDRPTGIQMAGTGGKGRWGITRSLLPISSSYRTVYLPVLRSLLPEMYSTFDFPDPAQLKGQREVTTVAPQALFLMNSGFAADISRDTAEIVLRSPARDDRERVRAVYLRLLGRLPAEEEVTSALDFLESLTGQSGETYRWAALIQALMISGEFRTLL